MATAFVVQNIFLCRGALRGPFADPRTRQYRATGPAHAVLSLTTVVNRSELGPVRLPQPQPRLASRARRRSPDSATFQRETRAHQRTTIPHTKKRFRSLRCSTRPKSIRAVSSTAPEPLPFGKNPDWYPEGTCRTGQDAVSWLCVLRRRGRLGHIPNTPLSLTRRWSSLKRLAQSTGQPRPSLSPPARTGLVVLKAGVPLNPSKAQTEALLRRAGMPQFPKKKLHTRWKPGVTLTPFSPTTSTDLDGST